MRSQEWLTSLSSGRKFSLVFAENPQAIMVAFYIRVGKLPKAEQLSRVVHV